ncbi:MAG: iron-sulfur cluster assembly scaffold protein [Actinomycetota bacterium]
MYSEQLMARFLEPAHSGDVASANGLGKQGNVTCGDVVEVAVRVEDGLIVEARFRAQGCATAIAAAEAACELASGGTMTAASTLDVNSVSALLGGIPQERLGCASVSLDALRSAVAEARRRADGG